VVVPSPELTTFGPSHSESVTRVRGPGYCQCLFVVPLMRSCCAYVPLLEYDDGVVAAVAGATGPGMGLPLASVPSVLPTELSFEALALPLSSHDTSTVPSWPSRCSFHSPNTTRCRRRLNGRIGRRRSPIFWPSIGAGGEVRRRFSVPDSSVVPSITPSPPAGRV